MSTKLLTGLMALSLAFMPVTALAQGADETPQQFMQRYLSTVANAKSLLEVVPLMKPRPDRPPMPEKMSAEDQKMMEFVLEMQKTSTPLKAEITDTQQKDGKILLILKATQVAPSAKLNLAEKGASATGKMLLEKGAKGWLVANDYWHFVYPNGLTTDSGTDPDAPPKVASPIDKYSDDIMAAITKVWPDPAQGTGQVTVEMKNNGDGKFELIGITDKHGNKDAEAAVSAAMSKISLPPLPSEVSDQPIVNIQLSWSPKCKDTMKMVQLLHSATLVK